jgi:hypothetical protein
LEETLLVEGSDALRKGLNAPVEPDDLILDGHDFNRSEICFMMLTSGVDEDDSVESEGVVDSFEAPVVKVMSEHTQLPTSQRVEVGGASYFAA